MGWRQTGDKPLFEAMLLCYTDAYASLGLIVVFNGIKKITLGWEDVVSFIHHPLVTETGMFRKN